MAALDFPTSPTNGQFYQGYVWNSTNGTWDSSYQADTLKPGLTQLIAPTVSVSGGTATANSLGTISFTAATSIRLNNIFSSAYTNYRVYLNVKTAVATGNNNVGMQFSGNGTSAATGYSYGATGILASTGGSQQLGGNNSASIYAGRIYDSGVGTQSVFDIGSPMLATYTTFTGTWSGSYPSEAQLGLCGGFLTNNNTYDGLHLSGPTNGLTGSVSVYGYAV